METIEKLPEFNNHRIITFLSDPENGLKGFISIHRGGLVHPAFGATRLWKYCSELEALKDTLKLSQMMSYKSAIHGLNYGGAKGVIMDTSQKLNKNFLLKAYAKKVNYLSGHFITGADIGLSQKDVKIMKKESPFFVGTKYDPAKFTALGNFYALSVCLKKIFGKEQLSERTFAIQGMGKIGMEFLKLIYKNSKKVFISDIDHSKIKSVKKLFPNIQPVKPSEIHKCPVDVFSPCALSNSITSKNISQLRCKIIIGGANNQLENDGLGKLLYKSGILYAPDFVVNAGGLISVVDEVEHKDYDKKRVNNRVKKIGKTLQRILEKSEKKSQSPELIAKEMAEKIFNKYE